MCHYVMFMFWFANLLISVFRLTSFSCFDTVGWSLERAFGPYNLSAFSSQLLLIFMQIKLYWKTKDNNNDRLTAFDPGQPG